MLYLRNLSGANKRSIYEEMVLNLGFMLETWLVYILGDQSFI